MRHCCQEEEKEEEKSRCRQSDLQADPALRFLEGGSYSFLYISYVPYGRRSGRSTATGGRRASPMSGYGGQKGADKYHHARHVVRTNTTTPCWAERVGTPTLFSSAAEL